MSASRPVDEFRDEWLSAYVDSELTPAERAAVEARLQTDPAARKLLGELRRTSEAVQALPRQTLGRDLRANVAAAIARQKTEIEPASNLAARPGEAARPSPRVWAWVAAAIAAGLLVMALLPRDTEDDRRVAEAPGEKDATGGAGVDAAVDARTGETPRAPTTGAAAPGADREVGQVKTVDAGGARSAMEPSAARRDADHGFIPTPAAAAVGGGMPVRRIDVSVTADDGAERFERLLAEQGVALSADAPPADVAALWATPADGAAADGSASIVDAVLVEATAKRIDALIAALRADSEAFAAVDDEGQAGAQAQAAPTASGAEGRGDVAGSAVAWRLKPGVTGALAADGADTPDAAERAGDRIRALFVLRGDAAER